MTTNPTNETAPKPKAVIILGMHRSGTSALSGTLGHLGGVMPKDLLPPTNENAVGFWESRPIVTANDELLGELNAEAELSTTDALYNPGSLRPLDLFYHLPMLDTNASDTTNPEPQTGCSIRPLGTQIDLDHWVNRLCQCVRQEFEQDGQFPTDQPMIIKDPRMCRLMPIWMIVLEKLGIQPAFIIALRHPSEVARSLSARSTIDAARAHWLWMDHMLRAEHATRGHNRVFMEYSDLLADWRSTVNRIDNQLGISFEIQDNARMVDAFLSPKHRHHAIDSIAHADLPDIVARAYTEFKLACEPPHQINAQAFEQIADEFSQTQQLSSAWIADAEHRYRQASADHQQSQQQSEKLQSRLENAQILHKKTQHQHQLLHQQKTDTLKTAFETRVNSLNEQLNEQSNELDHAQEQHTWLEHRIQTINDEHRSTLERLSDSQRDHASTKAQIDRTLTLNAQQIREIQRRAVPTRRLPIKLAADLLAFPIRHRKQMIENIRLVSESSLFDAQWYRSQNPDVDRAGVYPAAHYVGQGFTEGREPSPNFNAKWYLDTHRDVAQAGINPLVHYLRTGWLEQRAIQGTQHQPELALPKPDPTEPAQPISIEITKHSPSDFPLVDVDPTQRAKTTAVAFYLPQFHPIPENNQWWGEGFTEWNNVTRARPQFAGHQQPMRPGELGYYDLRLPETRQRQAQLAQSHGIGAFCYHYYWFNGRRVLERPLNDLLRSKDTSMPFCICWANENWTRRWDGLEQEVLLRQNHTLESDRRFFLDLLPTLEDERYLRVDGKPVIVIYRADLMANAQDSAAVWRDEAHRAGLGDIHLCAVQFRTDDPRSLGFDAAIEFPPHHFPAPEITHKVANIDPNFQGRILDWAAGAAQLIRKPLNPGYRLYRGVNPGWDNTARRMNAASIFAGATPERYEAWLRSAINQRQPDDGTHENLVFINAWNEWAEGAVLEPTETCNKAMLKATARAMGVAPHSESDPKPAVGFAEPKPVTSTNTNNPQLADRLKRFVRTTPTLNNFLDRRPALKNKAASIVQRVSDRVPASETPPSNKHESPQLLANSFWKPAPKELHNPDATTILIQSHDACLAGAQIVVLELLRHLAKDPSIRVYHLLCGSGVLEAEFRTLATTLCIDDLIARGLSREQAIKAAIDSVPNLQAALCNTAAVPEAVRACKQRGVRTIAYLHELPTTIDSMLGGDQTMRTIDQYADEIIVVSEFVRDRLCTHYQLPTDRLKVVYMGLFPSKASPPTRADARKLVCNELNINPDTPIVLGCGAIHPRKGTDLWVRAAAATIEQLTKADRPIPTFIWVGWDQAGPDFRSWCEHDVQASGISEHIKFIGVRDDTEHYFAAADVFALSSREDPFPLVNLESLVCKTPVVAFRNAGGAPEALISTKGDSGVVVGYADAQSMGHAIAELLSPQSNWDSLSHNAHRVMHDELGWDRYINSLLIALLPDRVSNTNLVEV